MRPGESASDEELVDLTRTGDPHDTRPFEILVQRHQGFVAANCRAIVRSPNDVDDLAQEVFVKAFFGLRRFERRAPFRAWLHRIKVNHCLNHLRRTRGPIMMEIEDPGLQNQDTVMVAPTAMTALEVEDDRERIVHALEDMSDALRLPLMVVDHLTPDGDVPEPDKIWKIATTLMRALAPDDGYRHIAAAGRASSS